MKTYHHGDLAAALLRAASALLEKEGVSGLSLREAARRAGVSHNAPYRHFPDRDALLTALAAEGFEILTSEMRGQTSRAMGEARVRFAVDNPQRFRSMFGGPLSIEKHAALRNAGQAAYQTLVDTFNEIPHPERAAAAAWSLMHGMAQLLLDGHFSGAVAKAGGPEIFVREVLSAVRFALTR